MWLLRQAEVPGREPLDAALVHARRERVFLWLAALFIAAATMLPLLGFSKWFGVSWVPRLAGYEPPVMLLLPLGVVAWPIALLAMNLVGELYGKSRARSLVLAMVIVWLGVLALLWATDRIPDYDQRVTAAFPSGVALVAAGTLALIVLVELFGWIAARWVRHLLAPLVAIALSWGAFFLVLSRAAISGAPRGSELTGAVVAAGSYTWLVVLVGTIPVVLLSRGLAIYLRVALRGSPTFVDDDDIVEPAFVVKKKKPFSTGEMAFFDDGDER